MGRDKTDEKEQNGIDGMRREFCLPLIIYGQDGTGRNGRNKMAQKKIGKNKMDRMALDVKEQKGTVRDGMGRNERQTGRIRWKRTGQDEKKPNGTGWDKTI
ncbi:unnamed protein product [Microthlaspi erraticum]|uniref:Uncharacterized protein n=1 Tax=Microthlaspi erraticum TaxID=1685480 RepID=A0A6D2LHL7_9BRAS|nr:unnamed protein product [Microthlaspi erraticum]